MSGIAPFQLFNAIRLGIPGTAMAAFPTFSDQEVWNLAFYVSSLRHGNGQDRTPIPNSASAFSLEDLSTHSDKGLEKMLAGSSEEKKAKISDLRLQTQSDSSFMDYLIIAREKLEGTRKAFLAGKYDEAKNLAVGAYLEGIEPIEPKLRARDMQLTHAIESSMSSVRSAISMRVAQPILSSKVDTALDLIAQSIKKCSMFRREHRTLFYTLDDSHINR